MSPQKRKSHFRPWRTITPVVAALVPVLLIARLSYPLPAGSGWLLWLSRLDPLLLLSQLRWGQAAWGWIWLPLLVLLVSLLMGRVFCGWLCPVGGVLAVLQAGRDWLAGRKIKAARPVSQGAPDSARYLWLAFVLILLLLGVNWPLLLTPYTLLGHEVVRLWLLQAPWLLAAAVALGIVVFPRFWCVYVCPTGLFLSAVSSLRRWRFTAGPACNHCGRCRSVCPVQAATPGGAAGEQCLLCGRCLESCPRGAISFTTARPGRSRVAESPSLHLESPPLIRPAHKQAPARSSTGQSRRNFLKGAAAILVLAAGGFWLQRAAYGVTETASAWPLRPPGALPEPEFAARCARCGRCIKVCPNQALQPMPLSSGLAAFDTPCLEPLQGRCEMCLLCQDVCPTGAIQQVPVEQVKIGTAVIDHPHCLAWGQGKYCLVCVEQCPFQAAVMDERQRPVVKADRCKGCGACENGCPVPGAAIHVYA